MPDSNPEYEKKPRLSSIEYFVEHTKSHQIVESIQKITPVNYLINRKGKNTINVFLTNIYTIGMADIYDIINENNTINCIVTVSGWNQYSNEAKELCKSLKIGLFTYREYYGALYYENERFINYETPKGNKKSKFGY